VRSAGASVDVSGVGGAALGDGRFLYGSNTSTSYSGSLVGTGAPESSLGSRAANALLRGGQVTPFIPGLADGAEVYGMLQGIDANSVQFDSLRAAAPGGALAALLRLDVGPSDGAADYADDFVGFDMLLLINLLDRELLAPMLGIDPAGVDASFLSSLLVRGFARNPSFGGSGPEALASLGAFGIYATLVPEGPSIANASAESNLVSGASLSDGGYVFLLPEPSSGPLAALGAGLLWLRGRRRRPGASEPR
jgi:hypothetical protein